MAATTGSMSAAEIAAAAKAAGWPDGDIPTAVAIALAESGGNPRAHNPNPPDDSYGLWQINMLGTLGPSRRAQFGISSNEALYDPVINAKAALAIRRGQGWTAWSVYTNGAYRKYTAQTAQFATNIPILPNPLPLGDLAGELGRGLAGDAASLSNWLNRGILRVAMFVGGGFLILLAIALTAWENKNRILAQATGVLGPARKLGKVVAG